MMYCHHIAVPYPQTFTVLWSTFVKFRPNKFTFFLLLDFIFICGLLQKFNDSQRA